MQPTARAPGRLQPLSYVVAVAAAGEQAAEVTLRIPADAGETFELAMATWSPGFYRAEDYAARLGGLSARAADSRELEVTEVEPGRWRVVGAAGGAEVRYRLACADSSVTTNWVGDGYALLCGPATFLWLAGGERREHQLRLDLPPGWDAHVALPPAPDAEDVPHAYIARDLDALLDAPMLAGSNLAVERFVAGGREHTLAAAGERGCLDLARAARDLARVAEASRALWGELPFERYHFLVVCREGGGGLEHADSTVVTAAPSRMATPAGYPAWLKLASHEYVHAVNVKRLRPRELGPFDYRAPARTPSLWFAEGLTCYYTDMLLCRAGLWSHAELLAGHSRVIAELQRSPGRLVQSLAQSSLAVWENSFSGLGVGDGSVSYYTKGHVVGFLLDMRILTATAGARSLDDLMRLAAARHSGAEGYTQEQIEDAVAELAGEESAEWLRRAVGEAGELGYGDALAWLGLAFAGADGSGEAGAWELRAQDPADLEAAARRSAWCGRGAAS